MTGNPAPVVAGRGVLYAVVCAAPPALQVRDLVERARADGWDVCVIGTPTAVRWLAADLTSLESLTGHPVRSAYKLPGEPDVLPPPDAILVAPATANTINKWGAGICDNLALGLICEAVGERIPLVALPFFNSAQAAHPAVPRNLAELRNSGVTILPGGSDAGQFDWAAGLDAVAGR